MRSPAMIERRFALWALALVAVLCTLPLAAPALADGLGPLDVARLQQVRDAVVSPDGAWTAYTLSVPRDPFDDEDGPAWSELHVLDPDGDPHPYVTGEVRVSDVAWTPDGRGISFLTKRDGDDHTSLYVIPLRGGEARRVLTHDTDITSYDWHPDGDRVAFLAKEEGPEEREGEEKMGFDQEVYEENLRYTRVWIADLNAVDEGDDEGGEPRMLELDGSASELRWGPGGDRLSLALAPTPLVDDALMLRRVKVVDAGSGEIVAEVENPGKLGRVAFSPDGEHLALISGASLHDPREGRLMVVPASGGEPTDLVPGYEGHVTDFRWKDGDTLLFIGMEGVESTVQEIREDGSGRATVVAGGGPIWSSLSHSAGGTALVADTPQHPSEVYRLEGGSPLRRTNSNPWLEEIELAPQEVVEYEARDGLMIQGLLIRPLDAAEGKRYPLIVVVHGGPEAHYSNGWLTRYSTPGQMAAARGFAVFYPNYRGSTGRGVEFSMLSQGDPAGKEFDDYVDGVDHLIATGLVDRDRVGITGGSYGGYATAWGSTYYSDRFAAGVMFVGISEKIAKWGSSDIPNELNWVHDRHWPWEAWDLMWERSPVRHVEKAETPLLILHGKEDTRVHPSQSLILYRYLKTLDRTPVRLVWYPKEGHGNRMAAHQLDYSLRMLRWFEHYLQGEGGEKPPAEVDYPLPEEEQEDGEQEGMEEDAGEEGDSGGESGVAGEDQASELRATA